MLEKENLLSEKTVTISVRELVELLELKQASSEPSALDDYGKNTYTVDEIQDILCVSKTTAYDLVKQGLFRSIRVGRHIRISKKSFDTWLNFGEGDK